MENKWQVYAPAKAKYLQSLRPYDPNLQVQYHYAYLLNRPTKILYFPITFTVKESP